MHQANQGQPHKLLTLSNQTCQFCCKAYVGIANLLAVVGASVEAAELFGEAVYVLLARGPACGLGVDACLPIGVDGGGALFHLVRDVLAQVLVDHLASDGEIE